MDAANGEEIIKFENPDDDLEVRISLIINNIPTRFLNTHLRAHSMLNPSMFQNILVWFMKYRWHTVLTSNTDVS